MLPPQPKPSPARNVTFVLAKNCKNQFGQWGLSPPNLGNAQKKGCFFSGRASLRYFLLLENIYHALGYVFRCFCAFCVYCVKVASLGNSHLQNVKLYDFGGGEGALGILHYCKSRNEVKPGAFALSSSYWSFYPIMSSIRWEASMRRKRKKK